MRKIIAGLIGMAFAGCFTAKKANPPSLSDVDRVSSKFPGYTMAQLNEGKALYESNCNTCHGLKKPSSEPEAEWRRIVPEMTAKVNKKAMVLNKEQEDRILKYLITMTTR